MEVLGVPSGSRCVLWVVALLLLLLLQLMMMLVMMAEG